MEDIFALLQEEGLGVFDIVSKVLQIEYRKEIEVEMASGRNSEFRWGAATGFIGTGLIKGKRYR